MNSWQKNPSDVLEQGSLALKIQPAHLMPLFVDLDGTLIKTDSLMESLIRLMKKRPFYLLSHSLFWLFKGKGYFKHQISQLRDFDPQSLPYQEVFLEYLRQQKNNKRDIYLITGSHQTIANAVAKHLGLFSNVYATDQHHNLVGSEKLKLIQTLVGGSHIPFAYAGNAHVDKKIWNHASEVIIVNPHVGVSVSKSWKNVMVFDDRNSKILSVIKGMRVHQWVKNILLFIPLLMAHRVNDINNFVQVFLGFVSFSLCASSVYLLNDLLDLDSDRIHPTKRMRPLANADMSILEGVVLIPVLLILSGLIGAILGSSFLFMLAGYYALTLLYSFKLKEMLLLDVLCLSLLYNMRILTGAVITSIPLSPWLLGFTAFLFYSLALAKRAAELVAMKKSEKSRKSGRNYTPDDLPQVSISGSTSGVLCVLVYALYINSENVQKLYSNPLYLWPVGLALLYWISRVWMLTSRGEMHQDPIVFALKDRTSYVVAGLVLVLTLCAMMG